MIALISLVFAYLIGSINTSILVCRAMGLVDPRTTGSKNPGTTNVLRTGNKQAAIITLVGDVAKGFIAALLAKILTVTSWGLGFTAVAVTLGHVFPIFFQFKGGKGVTTAIGSILCLSWLLGLLLIAVWIITAAVSRYSSLAALVATVTAPIFAYCFNGLSLAAPLMVLSLLLLWRHQANIQRLLQGQETKIHF